MFCSCIAAREFGAELVAEVRYTAAVTVPAEESCAVTLMEVLLLVVATETRRGAFSMSAYDTERTLIPVAALY